MIHGNREFYLRDLEMIKAHLSKSYISYEVKKSLKDRLLFIELALSRIV